MSIKDTFVQCCGSWMFYPSSEHFFTLDPDVFSSWIRIRTFFHPGFYMKRGMKNKTNFFLPIYGFQVQFLVVSIDIRIIDAKGYEENYFVKMCRIRAEKIHPGSRSRG
jgi:hypothetical protein